MRLSTDLIQPVIDALTAEFSRPDADAFAKAAALRERTAWRKLKRQAEKTPAVQAEAVPACN